MLVTIALVLLGTVTGTQAYEIVRSTFGGGATSSSNSGVYELQSTTGQGSGGTMSGELYSVSGGFWYAVAPGDCGSDGYVDLFDHQQFVDCMTGPDLSSQDDTCRCYDVNQSGTVDLQDFAQVQAAFTGG